MAYMSQEKKKKIAEELKKALKGTGLKYTLGVHNHSTLVMNIKSGPIDFIGNHVKTMLDKAYTLQDYQKEAIEALPKQGYMDINHYWYHEHFTGVALEVMKKIIDTMHIGNHDNSDPMTDYFDVGWYVDVNVGKWEKPYVCTAHDPAIEDAIQNAKDAKKVELEKKIVELKDQLNQAVVQYQELVAA